MINHLDDLSEMTFANGAPGEYVPLNPKPLTPGGYVPSPSQWESPIYHPLRCHIQGHAEHHVEPETLNPKFM